jgi:hypothetical protein
LTAPIVKRVDHLNIVVPRPRALFDVLTRRLAIPIERPWARFPAFESGQAMLGTGHEPITYAPGRRTPVPPDAGIFAIALEPEPLARALPELARRGVPHSLPLAFDVTYADDPDAFALDPPAGSGTLRRRWTLVTLGGLFADDTSAHELSRWPRRGDARGGRTMGRVIGRLASGRLGGVLMARTASARPFCFLCEFHSFDVAESRAAIEQELSRRDGGPLGLIRTSEVVLTARDAAAETERWQRLLDPAQPSQTGRWELGDGPAIKISEGPEDQIRALVWEVRSLDRAADWLRGEGWLGDERDGHVSIAADPLQGLDIQLTERSGRAPAEATAGE